MTSGKNAFDVIGQLEALRRYARSLVRDASEAEDLVHDALVKAYEKRATFRLGANLRSWLLSIVHNTHVDRLRHTRSVERRHVEAAFLTETIDAANPDHSIRLRQLREAFYDLADEQREALHLVAIEGLSYQDAAAALGVPVGTLMSRLSRARAKLRSFEDRNRSGEKRHLKLIGGAGHED